MDFGVNFTERYGALPSQFSLQLTNGYHVLLGQNNSGKSTVLQACYIQVAAHGSFGFEKCILLTTQRDFVADSLQPANNNLANYNQTLANTMNKGPLSHESANTPAQNILPSVLLTHGDHHSLTARLKSYLTRLELPDLRSDRMLAMFDGNPASRQGSGLRSLYLMLAALADESIEFIAIDEPELSLEAGIQHGLRDLLVEESKSRCIMVATHSHLFANRIQIDHNHRVAKDNGFISVRPLANEAELLDITFNMLGSDTKDLFFPGNFLVVEGVSDQVICEKVIELIGAERGALKVLAARGITMVADVASAIIATLTPVVTGDSPYATRVVVVVDKSPKNASQVEKLKLLGDRFCELPSLSLEEYLPESLYSKAGRSKTDDLKELSVRKSNLAEVVSLKKEISNNISAVLDGSDLDLIPELVDAVRKALRDLSSITRPTAAAS